MTLLELLVALGLMSVVMAVITTGMMQIYSTLNRNEELSLVQSQLHTAFQRLDREIRYASGIRPPNQTPSGNGSWYVEYSVSSAGVEDCVQLRFTDAQGRLQRRTRHGAGSVGTWTTLAAHVAVGARFALEPAAANRYPHQQLTISLTSRARAGTSSSSRQAEYTFTALNSSIETTHDVCTDLNRP
jgi:type II secretory pathway pseudopilin PulG